MCKNIFKSLWNWGFGFYHALVDFISDVYVEFVSDVFTLSSLLVYLLLIYRSWIGCISRIAGAIVMAHMWRLWSLARRDRCKPSCCRMMQSIEKQRLPLTLAKVRSFDRCTTLRLISSRLMAARLITARLNTYMFFGSQHASLKIQKH